MKFGTTDVRMAQCLIREVCGLALMPDEHDRRVVQLLKLPENLLQACFEALVGPRTVVTGEDVATDEALADGWYWYGTVGGAHYLKKGAPLCGAVGLFPGGWLLCRDQMQMDSACEQCWGKLEKPERVGDAVHDALREALPKADLDIGKVKDVLRDEPPAPAARPDWIDTPDWFDKKYGGKEFKTGTIYNLLLDLADAVAERLRPHHEDAERG